MSSRTYLTGGHWAKVLEMIKPGDFVIMQFGHNDSSAVNDNTRARGTLKGAGDETEEIDNALTKQREVVQYLRLVPEEIHGRGTREGRHADRVLIGAAQDLGGGQGGAQSGWLRRVGGGGGEGNKHAIRSAQRDHCAQV
ncbi:MAG: hypothetical protein QM760_17630 [Nibricoccus sp.]